MAATSFSGTSVPSSRPWTFYLRPTLLMSSWFGLGLLPRAPGTFGTLGAIPLWWVLRDLPWSLSLGATVLLTLLAIRVADRAERLYGSHDNQQIVIDEVVGLLWATLGVPMTGWTTPVAFLLFRLLDATKPGPIGWADRELPGGRGVVVDDVFAGIGTLGLMWALFSVLGRWP